MTKGTKPRIFDEVLARSENVVTLFDNKVINTTTEQNSEGVWVAAFRRFLLFVKTASTGAPTTLQIKAQFLDEDSGLWHSYKQGIFASLFYEDGDTADGIYECFTGDVVGRQMRVTLTGAGVDSTKYFTTTIAAEFMN